MQADTFVCFMAVAMQVTRVLRGWTHYGLTCMGFSNPISVQLKPTQTVVKRCTHVIFNLTLTH